MSNAKGGLTSSQIVQPLLDSPTAVGMDSFVVNVLPVSLVSAPIDVLVVDWEMRCLTAIRQPSWTTGVNISLSRMRILSQGPWSSPEKDRVDIIHPVCWTYAPHVGCVRGNHHSPNVVIANANCHLTFLV